MELRPSLGWLPFPLLFCMQAGRTSMTMPRAVFRVALASVELLFGFRFTS